MKLGIIIYSDDAEVIWNAFRLGNFALDEGDEVKVFLLAKGVEAESHQSEQFNIREQMKSFVDKSGKILTCKTCLTLRKKESATVCDISTMKDLYAIIKAADKVITF